MLISAHITAILYATGIVTALAVLQFFFPAKFLKQLNQIEIHDEAGIFFARHWGLVVFSVGALLIYAADHPEARNAIMLFALIEKLGLVAQIVLNAKRPFARGLRAAAAFDAVCCLIYVAYLAKVM